ncbi:MAG TPA: tRNA (guanosine(46)-N7)-methyltransferase TrmB [Candidatus Polarisedimenticolia bacterium]|nr:tRNA (guanosine(46)-N7)-methyltransferase TrmB [Candidatus Polarisedimenticolia bacterium]
MLSSQDDPPAGVALEILPGQVSGRLSFAALFGNSRPVEIEVGIGKGRFLLRQAELRPEVNFLGLEWSLKHLRVAKERAARQGLTNVRLYRADARHVIAELIPDASVARLHVYCPDPWPKKRHHKRRFFTPETAPHLERILVPGGYLDLSTDVLEYFEEMRQVLGRHTTLEAAADPLFPLGTGEGNTNYEVKYLRVGREIHRASYIRPAAS